MDLNLVTAEMTRQTAVAHWDTGDLRDSKGAGVRTVKVKEIRRGARKDLDKAK